MIEMGKKYRTRDGREVRIYAVDGGGVWPVQGAIASRPTPGRWDMCCWLENGGASSDDAREMADDLIEVLPEKTSSRSVCLSGDGIAFTAAVGCESGVVIGAIDITHNGKEIVRVEVVK